MGKSYTSPSLNDLSYHFFSTNEDSHFDFLSFWPFDKILKATDEYVSLPHLERLELHFEGAMTRFMPCAAGLKPLLSNRRKKGHVLKHFVLGESDSETDSDVTEETLKKLYLYVEQVSIAITDYV